MQNDSESNRSYGTAWLLLCCGLALHVFDEASNNFLALYNPTVLAIRKRFPLLPLPTFTFRVWITLLLIAIACLLVLSIYAYRGARWLRGFAYFFAIAMIANGSQHLAASAYLRRFVAGAYSSPLMIAAAVYLLIVLKRTRRARVAPQ
jgi:Protein of unknown function with HXXEE motif